MELMKVRKLVSIVCPVYNEERAVPLFYQRLIGALKGVEDRVRFEFLFVNNRSTDQTAEEVRKLREKDPRVQLLTMSRNFGYQASISAGMRHATGDAIVNIDVDCEDPPELIPQFIERWLAGADVAYGVRAQREEFVLMHWARKFFYRLTRLVSDHEIVLDMAEFFLVDKRGRDAVLATRSTFPFVRGQVGYVGFKREGVPYKSEKRIVGETHYNLLSAIRFGVAGILSSSTLPLRVLAYLGAVLFAVDGVTAVMALTADLGRSLGLVKWIAAVVLLNLAGTMAGLSLIGIYLARVYKDVMSLPLYVTDEKLSTIEGRRVGSR